MRTASVHWRNGVLYIYVTALAPADVSEVVTLAQVTAKRFLGKSALAYRVGPRRRAMTFRRSHTYAFTAFTTERGVVEDGGI